MLRLPALWLTLGALLCQPQSPASHPSTQRVSKGVDWLTRYGYLPPPDPMQARLQTQEGLRDAVRMMQKFAGLQETGILDERTLAMMDQPRCSLPDIIGTSELMRRRKRYAHSGTVWPKKQLTWRIRSYPQSSSLSQNHVRNLLFYALQAWSNVSALTFLEELSDSADILVDFSRSFHQDGYPFDGPGSTLAHAFFPGEHPISGDTHFDDEETWIYDPQAKAQGAGTDLFAVAVHEFGHALGLAHSSTKESIMMPYYQGPVGLPHLYQLPPDDTLGIQTLYGRRQLRPGEDSPARPIPTQPPIPDLPPHRATQQPRPPAPDRCQAHFDAIANIRGEVFFFKKKHFWRMQPARNLVSLEPAQIQRFWMGLPTDFGAIDAVYERTNDSKIIFFIERGTRQSYQPCLSEGTRYWHFDDWAGTVEPRYRRLLILWNGVPPGLDNVISWNDGQRFWVFSDTQADPGSPRPLTDLGLPSGVTVEAAFVWGHNGKTYFFEGARYWRFDDRAGTVEPGYPRPLTLWKGISPGLDDVISWNDGSTYFFKGTQYWRFLGGSVEAKSGYPKSVPQDWMYCQGSPATTSGPGSRGGPGDPGGGQCLCNGALPGPLPALLIWILALPWALR